MRSGRVDASESACCVALPRSEGASDRARWGWCRCPGKGRAGGAGDTAGALGQQEARLDRQAAARGEGVSAPRPTHKDPRRGPRAEPPARPRARRPLDPSVDGGFFAKARRPAPASCQSSAAHGAARRLRGLGNGRVRLRRRAVRERTCRSACHRLLASSAGAC